MSLAGLTLDRLATYGKKSTLLWVQWSITGGSGAIDVITGHGFSSSVVRPHQGSVARTDTGDYTITLPGDGGTYYGIVLAGLEVVGESLEHTVTAIDLSDGTIDLTFHASDDADESTPVDPAAESIIQAVILVSDWPHL